MLTVRAFPNTDLEKYAREQGVPEELIKKSQDLSYEDVTPSLNFRQDFTKGIKTIFLKDYVLNKEDKNFTIPITNNICLIIIEIFLSVEKKIRS